MNTNQRSKGSESSQRFPSRRQRSSAVRRSTQVREPRQSAISDKPDGAIVLLSSGPHNRQREDQGSIGGSEAQREGELWEETEAELRHANASTQLRILRGRLQLDSPPSYTTITLPLTRLVVPDEARLSRRGRPFSVNVGLMGMLHPPSVTPIPGTDTYRVITGRGRVIGARLLGEPEMLECHCYERLSRTDETLLILSENMRRAPAWVQEVAALAELIDTRVGMTDQELAILFGLSVTTIRERLKLALLPPGIRSQVTSGTVSYAVARRITRLTAAATALLEDQAQEGEAVAEDMVKQAMRGQIGAGMGVVRHALAESGSPWDAVTTWSEIQTAQETQRTQREVQGNGLLTDLLAQSPHGDVLSASADQSPREHDIEAAKQAPADNGTRNTWNHAAVEQLLHDLLAVGQMLGQLPGTARASMLAQALHQEIKILQRTVPATPLTQPIANPEVSAPKTKPRTRPGRTKNVVAESERTDLSIPSVRADDASTVRCGSGAD
jgi:ParB-like chromosome segregation protein Spo0J